MPSDPFDDILSLCASCPPSQINYKTLLSGKELILFAAEFLSSHCLSSYPSNALQTLLTLTLNAYCEIKNRQIHLSNICSAIYMLVNYVPVSAIINSIITLNDFQNIHVKHLVLRIAQNISEMKVDTSEISLFLVLIS